MISWNGCRERVGVGVWSWGIIQKIVLCITFKQKMYNKSIGIILQMRKRCTFEENTIHNFQIEEEFDQIMQIEGLADMNQEKRELFASIKHLFRSHTAINIIGQGPNANIKSFYYLLLCHIRKEHYKKLVTDFKQKQFENDSDDEQLIGRRDRRVSFNDKRALFLNGPQYENYCLHKLKIFAFSRETDLTMIKNTPFEKEPTLKYKGEKLSSLMMKKLLSQFLKELLPETLHSNYKDDIRSVKYYLNKHKSIGIIFTILMRYILLSKYQVESARDFQEEVNDHTVCTTLCDAFAIDGLLCKDNLYEINTWCKVHSLEQSSKKIFFIEMFNDQFEELGRSNQRRNSIINRKATEKEVSIVSNLQSSEQQGKSAAFGLKDSEASSSLMGADEESEVASSAQWHNVENNIRAVESEQFKSLEERSNSLSNNTFRETFNSNRQQVQQAILNELQREEANTSGQRYDDASYEQMKREEFIKLSENSSIPIIFQQKEQKFQEFIQENAKPSKKYQDRGQEDDQNLAESQGSSKSKGIRVIKIGYREQGQPNIVNNNISNNIYVNLGGDSSKQYLIPVINISTTKESDTNSDSYIKINLS